MRKPYPRDVVGYGGARLALNFVLNYESERFIARTHYLVMELVEWPCVCGTTHCGFTHRFVQLSQSHPHNLNFPFR